MARQARAEKVGIQRMARFTKLAQMITGGAIYRMSHPESHETVLVREI